MGVPVKLLATCALLLASACAPLTYSEEGAIDFQTYSSVRVSVTSASYTGEASKYLAGELEKTSGFATVTLDPAASVSAILSVALSITLSPTVDDQGNSVDQYDATATYTLTAGSTHVDSGSASGTASNDIDAVESALDGVATHYIAPYRL